MRFNTASGNDGAGHDATRINWSELVADTNPLNALDGDLELSVSGDLWVDLNGFVQVFGGFAFTKSSMDVTLAGETEPTTVDVMTFALDQVNVFVGAGPYFNPDGEDHADKGQAVGLLLKDVTLAVGLFRHTDGPGSGKYYAISAFAQDFELVGLELNPSESFFLDASGYRIEVNGGDTGAINFAADGGFQVGTVVFDYTSALQRVAIEDATLIIGDYVYISGGFALTRQTAMDVELSGSGTDHVDVIAIGAGNVDVFVGSGPYFIEGSENRDPDAVGLALENVNFGILLMRSTDTPSRKYTALKATADRVGLVGLDSLILSASGVSVEYNSSNRPGDTVIDFSNDVYLLDTGNGELEIDYETKVLRASVDDARLQINSYVFISGGLAFSKGPTRQVDLTVGTANVSTIDIGAEDLTIFFGVDGPYWTDLDGSNTISWSDADGNTLSQDAAGSDDEFVDVGETAELNPDAVGLAITNANLAMTLRKTVGGTTKYLALHATADQVGFVGIDAFQLEGSTVAVDLNLALGAGATNTTPVVNFASTYAGNERQALFDFLGGGDDISVVELEAAFGVGFATEAVSTVEQLMMLLDIGGAPPDGILPDEILLVTEVVDQLSNSLSEGELEDLKDQILALDADGDGKFDPIGYEVITGSGSLYLSAAQRQIHASADQVLINVAEFLYVQGSVALDIGSRETVTIRTGIPAGLGSEASDAVALINDALADLSGGLNGLKTAVQTKIQNAINVSLRPAVEGLLDDVIDSIVSYLETELANFVGTVGDLTDAQLNAAADAVRNLVSGALNDVLANFSVDSLLDQLIDPIVNEVIEVLPELLRDPVSGLLDALLDPIREKINSEFGATLQEALDDAIERITASVSEAIEAALQAAASTVTATIAAAELAIEEAISNALDPQFDRVDAQLQKLVAKALARLDPLFVRLQAITQIEIEEDFSTIKNVEVEVTALGISNATAFVGLPPDGGFNFSQLLSEQISTAIGLYVEGFEMGLGIFKPVLSKKLPTFTALRLHADVAGFSDGDPTGDVLELIAKVIDVELNLGGPIVEGAGALFGNATIDFVVSFSNANSALDGYPVQTGTTILTPTIYLDFEGERILASVKYASLTISEFVHITGSFAFEKGTVQTVDVTGGTHRPGARCSSDWTRLAPPSRCEPYSGNGSSHSRAVLHDHWRVERARFHRLGWTVLDR